MFHKYLQQLFMRIILHALLSRDNDTLKKMKLDKLKKKYVVVHDLHPSGDTNITKSFM